MNGKMIGIDLGTTNSEVAVIEAKQPVLFKKNKSALFPSYVGVDQDGNLLVGEEARNQYPVYPERTVKSIKRLMGSGEKVSMAGREYAPQEISAIILKSLKHIAETELNQPVTKAVITVPAYFSDVQRQATREAAEIAGFKSIKMINEPTAAALAYVGNDDTGKTIMVYDLGGGTFDVSIVCMEDGVIEVVASHGNNHLGGDDFDGKIVDYVYEKLEEEYGQLNLPAEATARITRAAELAKHTLSDNPFAEIREEYLFENNGVPVHLRLEISRGQYEEMITPFIEETLGAIHTALKSGGMTVSDIEEILLVGGSTRTPLVQRFIEREFGLQPRSEVNPDLCVACGAAIQAGVIGGEEVSAVLVDITPYTFGTSTLSINDQSMNFEEIYVPLIRKNSPIPIKKSEIFYTLYDNQTEVRIRVFQGEHHDPMENIAIGEFLISDLSKVPEGNEIINTFELDTDGILQVSATEKCTGKTQKIFIDNVIGRLAEKEMIKAKGKIVELFGEKSRPTEKEDENSKSVETPEVSRAKAAMEKADILMADADAEDREEMVDLMEEIMGAIEANNTKSLTEVTDELNEIIFYLES